MKLDFTIDGVPELLKACDQLRRPSAVKRVMTAALKGGLDVIGKQMKKDLSPRVKLGRAAVKSKVQIKRGQLTAKVGFGVGRKRKKTAKQQARLAQQKAGRPKGRGVGIGAANVHWWIMGTKERRTGFRKRGGYKIVNGQRAVVRQTGAMPAMQPGLASRAMQAVRSQITPALKARGAKALQKELNKIIAKK